VIPLAGTGPLLTGVFRYPVKSCRGEALETAAVEPWGIAGDRRWMLVGKDGEAVTARKYPALVLVTPRRDGDVLRLTRAGAPDLEVALPGPDTAVDVTVWRNGVIASEAAPEAHAWFGDLVREPVRLVYLDDPTRRTTNPEFSLPGDRVSFADSYPLLLTTTDSLAALNDWIADGKNRREGPLPMTRFRPNAVVSGVPAWAEDTWRRVRIGAMEFRIAKACSRCVLTTVDPDTAIKGREPLVTLGKHRRWDSAVWFGVNVIPERPGTMAVGDPFEVLE
jgi:uncharacterized protein YcbX